MVLLTGLAYLLLQTKHLIVDWCWQPPYEFMNKGTYGHWGGIRHALKNAIGTALIMAMIVQFGLAQSMLVAAMTFVLVLVVDFVLHYHIDWAKMNINRHYGLEPTKHANFWRLTGFDQFLHQITYVGIVTSVFYFL